MNDSLPQYCPSDLHGYLAVLVRTTSPQHIFSPQVQTPPGRPRQLQAHLGEIPPGQERLDPLRSSSRSLRAARQHESEDRRRAQQQRFHRGGGEFSLLLTPRQELSLPVEVRFCRSKCVVNASRLFRRCPEVVGQEDALKGPNRRRPKQHFTCFFLWIYIFFYCFPLAATNFKFSLNFRLNVDRCVVIQRELS